MAYSEWQKISTMMVDVAMGRTPANMVIRDGRWVNVQSGEIIPHTDIAIMGERIAFVGQDASHTIGDHTEIIEAGGRFLLPGLLDGHMHVESGMLTVTEFVRAVIPHGTTGMFIDPHEIANVFGIKGVKLMADEALVQPIHVWVEVPSCVPSAPGLETPGASITPEDVSTAMKWENIIGLGEVMNFPGVYNSDDKMHAEMAATRQAGGVISGHYASPDLGRNFHGYVAGGPQDDHEGTTIIDAVARVRQGMKAMLRFGSAWHDVDDQIRAVTELGLNPRNFILCTDDCHSETLVKDGHVNRAVQRAIDCGVEPLTAIQMATINTAEHFGVSTDVGMIAPGRYADILILSDLSRLKPDTVIVKGWQAAIDGRLMLDIPAYTYPDWATKSIHLDREITAADFRLVPPDGSVDDSSEATANVIGVIENQAPTRHIKMVVPVVEGEVKVERERDLAKIALLERHHGTGRIQVGLVHGFELKAACAIGSTVAHDSHHMIVIGTDEADMARAANELAKMNGGQIVVKNGQVIGKVELPIAGLMSNERADIVADKAASILSGFKTCGCNLNNPNMQLSLLALVVIPELRLSDMGLVDVTRFKIVPVLEPTGKF